jgi:hypothetical protein
MAATMTQPGISDDTAKHCARRLLAAEIAG